MLGFFLSDTNRNRWLQKVHRWARQGHGWNNRALIKHRMHKVRPPMSAAFDTDVSQICKIERGAWYSTGKASLGDHEIDTGYYGLMESPFADAQRSEIPYLNAICEMARRDQLLLYRLPTVELEKRGAPNRHVDHLGCVNLDHGVRFRDLGFTCSRMKFTFGKLTGYPFTADASDCEMHIGRHQQLMKFFSGKKQVRDAWHLMLCDSLGVEFFFACDGPFHRRYAQVKGKLEAQGLRTRVMRPSDFCKALGIAGVPVAPTDAKGALRGTIR